MFHVWLLKYAPISFFDQKPCLKLVENGKNSGIYCRFKRKMLQISTNRNLHKTATSVRRPLLHSPKGGRLKRFYCIPFHANIKPQPNHNPSYFITNTHSWYTSTYHAFQFSPKNNRSHTIAHPTNQSNITYRIPQINHITVSSHPTIINYIRT